MPSAAIAGEERFWELAEPLLARPDVTRSTMMGFPCLRVRGQFFASTDRFAEAFDFKEVLDSVVIDVSAAHFWDISAVGILDKAILKFRREGATVEVVGLNQESATMVDRFAIHDKTDAAAPAAGH